MVGFRLYGDIRRRRRDICNDFLRQSRIGRARPPPRHEFPPQLLVFPPQRIAFRFQFANLRRQRRHDGFCGCRRCNRFNRRIRHHHATEQVRTHEQRNAPATEAAAPSVFQSAEHRHDHCSFVGLRLYHKTPSPSAKKLPTIQTKNIKRTDWAVSRPHPVSNRVSARHDPWPHAPSASGRDTPP